MSQTPPSPSMWSVLTQPLQPAARAARSYSVGKFRRDLLAGLTVAVVEVPQAMAYALIAGVPPEYGIYTSIIQGILGALLSSGEHLTTGPTNTQSLLIASAVTRLTNDPGVYLQLVIGLTMVKGLIQLAFAAAKMGTMVRYVSRSVITGVAAGAGVLIAIGQLPHLLGVKLGQETHHLPGALGAVERLLAHVDEINLRSLWIGLGALAVMLGIRSVSKFLPGALIAVIGSAGAVAAMGWTSADLPLIPPLPQGLPSFSVPSIGWAESQALLGGALALALLGMLESVAIGKTLASHTGERINANQEFFAQGAANFISSFFGCIPGSGSFTRSALDQAAGAQTRFAAVYNALLVASIYLLLAPLARYIPLASLAAVLMVIAYGLIDWRYFVRVLGASRPDAVVFFITLLATLTVPLEYAIFTGILLNISLYLRNASRLHIAEMVSTPGGPFIERPVHDRQGQKQVIFLQLEGDLFFAVADELHDRLTDVGGSGVRVVILRLKRTHSIDSTVLHVLEQFTQQMHHRGGHVLLCGVKPELMQTLRAYGLIKTIGKDNVFEAGYGVFTSAKRALDRARQLLKSSLDTSGVDMSEETQGWAYEI